MSPANIVLAVLAQPDAACSSIVVKKLAPSRHPALIFCYAATASTTQSVLPPFRPATWTKLECGAYWEKP
jgi:hypothetical protein